MTGRERIRKTFHLEPTDRIPWLPFVGSHAASLIDITPDTYLQSEDAIVRGMCRASELYAPDGLPVVFDLQVEAEALGCQIRWSKENPPAVISHIWEGKDLSSFQVPGLDSGRIPLIMNAAARLRAELPDISLFGLITGPFTLAMHLTGVNLFIQMFDNPGAVKDFLMKMHDIGCIMADKYLKAGCDVIAVVDPMTSQIGPEHFREFVTPAVSGIFRYVREKGALNSFFVCGDAQKNVTVMAESGPDNICIDENIPLDFVKAECLKRGISFGGNMRLTTVMLLGTPEDNAAHAVDCMEVGGEIGYVLAPGCDIPYAAPTANIQAIARVISNPYEREIALELARNRDLDSIPQFDLSEYGRADRVIVDVITLDSEGCAPCQYMVESVRETVPEFEGLVEWREHKIKHTEGLAFMTALMVRNIPTICIDGKIRFVSIMPKREELIAAIQERINEKLRFRIARKRGEILIFGDDTEKTTQTLDHVRQAITELGSDIQAVLVTDPDIAASFGVRTKPAVIVARYAFKHAGKVPEIKIIKEWIKHLDD
jgi:uroporphyrinogen decarboxylase